MHNSVFYQKQFIQKNLFSSWHWHIWTSKPGVLNLFSPRVTKLNSGVIWGRTLKRTENKKQKKKLNSQGNNHSLLIGQLMSFSITKQCNIRLKWRGWQNEHIRQMMIWQSGTQLTLGMLHFVEQLYAVPNMLPTC